MIDKCYIIPVEKSCNANCEFCISKSRDYNKGVDFLDVNSKFVENLELLKKRGIKRFEITGGGEPMLHKDIELIVKLIKSIIPDSYVKIYTNGNINRKIEGIDEVNISVAHHDTQINDQIMNPVIKGLQLEGKMLNFRRNPGTTLRLSVPLVKGGIDSKEKLDEFINETKFLVNGYVFRTLYPGCPNYDEWFSNYNSGSVIFERDNNVGDFSGIILWSDGKLYTDWNLDKKRNMYSYMLLKPDSRIYINEIDKYIKDSGFNINKRLLVNDFINNASNLYLDKTKEYLEIVKRHLINSATLFGNQGLVYILDKNESLDSLVKDTYDLKVAIRNNFGFTGNYGGYINYEGENFHLNLVHAPDAIVDFYNRDLNVIEKFDDTREISDEEFSLVKRYRSYNL